MMNKRGDEWSTLIGIIVAVILVVVGLIMILSVRNVFQ